MVKRAIRQELLIDCTREREWSVGIVFCVSHETWRSGGIERHRREFGASARTRHSPTAAGIRTGPNPIAVVRA